MIKTTAFQAATEYCRGIYKSGDKDAYRVAKAENLAAFAVSGWCEGPLIQSPKEGRFHHNGSLQGDFDGKDQAGMPFDEILTRVQSSPYVKYAFRSPSGDGVKAIIRIPASCDLHNLCFDTAVRHFASLGLKMDTTTRNINRLCYIPSDPDIWVNPNEAVELEPVMPPEPSYRPPASPGGAGSSKPPPNQIREMLARIPTELGHADWLRLSNSVLAAAPDQETAVALLNEWWIEDSPKRYERLFRSPLEKIGVGTLFFYARHYGWVPEDEIRPFPTECLPGVAGQMAQEIARVIISRNDRLAGASVLGVLSAACGAGIEYRLSGEMIVRPNLFILGVADSGDGKSTALDIAKAPLMEIEKELVDRFNREVKAGLMADLQVSEKTIKNLLNLIPKADVNEKTQLTEQLKAAQQVGMDIERKIEAEPCLVVNDATQEALQRVIGGQAGEAVASITAEARGVLNIVKGRYGKRGGDEAFYTSAYSGEAIKVNRVSRESISLVHPCLTAVWMVQPDAFRDAADETALSESGFLQRFLTFDAMAEAQPSDHDAPPIPTAIKVDWEKLIRSLVEAFRLTAAGAFVIQLDDGARLILRNYGQECIRQRGAGGDHRDMKAFVARWAEHAARIALVLHCAEHGAEAMSKPLTAATAENAVRLMRWFAAEQIALYSGQRRKKLARRLEDLVDLLKSAGGQMSLRDLGRSRGFRADEVKQLQREFPACLVIDQLLPEGGGRPSPTARLVEGSP